MKSVPLRLCGKRLAVEDLGGDIDADPVGEDEEIVDSAAANSASIAGDLALCALRKPILVKRPSATKPRSSAIASSRSMSATGMPRICLPGGHAGHAGNAVHVHADTSCAIAHGGQPEHQLPVERGALVAAEALRDRRRPPAGRAAQRVGEVDRIVGDDAVFRRLADAAQRARGRDGQAGRARRFRSSSAGRRCRRG